MTTVSNQTPSWCCLAKCRFAGQGAIRIPEEVCDRVIEAAERMAREGLESTDDGGFSPFDDDVWTARETAFEKIRTRVEGTQLGEAKLH